VTIYFGFNLIPDGDASEVAVNKDPAVLFEQLAQALNRARLSHGIEELSVGQIRDSDSSGAVARAAINDWIPHTMGYCHGSEGGTGTPIDPAEGDRKCLITDGQFLEWQKTPASQQIEEALRPHFERVDAYTELSPRRCTCLRVVDKIFNGQTICSRVRMLEPYLSSLPEDVRKSILPPLVLESMLINRVSPIGMALNNLFNKGAYSNHGHDQTPDQSPPNDG
jgi:hypothetical protein